MVWLTLSVGLAAAVPEFDGEQPRSARIARNAWEAAEVCTGWSPPSHALVEIVQTELPEGQQIRGQRDGGGLRGIEVGGRRADAMLLVREVARSWIGEGPTALSVGRLELLVDCIADEDPRLVGRVPDDGRRLEAMPDLLTWESRAVGMPTLDATDPTIAGWWGAARLLRQAARSVEAQRFWPETRQLDWDAFAALMLSVGAEGEALMGLLAGGVEKQRDGLVDLDRDGLSMLGETLAGTDPTLWDTDGDGWWDGARRPDLAEAVPLPPDGLPICLAAGGNGPMGGVVLDLGGDLRGLEIPEATLLMKTRDIDLVVGSNYHRVPSGRPAVVRLTGELARSTGGVWVAPVGSDTTVRRGCMADERMVVWASHAAQRKSVQRFHTLSVEVHKTAEVLLGPTSVHVTVVLGEPTNWVDGNTVGISRDALRWAEVSGRMDWLATLSVALWRTDARLEPKVRYEQAEALARALVDDAPEDLVVAENWREVNQWTRIAEDCETGWKGLLIEQQCWIQ